jgi:lysophospholipase L1-like esterase
MGSELVSGQWRLIRSGAIVVGASLAIVALWGDRIGLGDAGGFGATQALALLFGVALLVIGWAGSRLPALYRGAALMLLNIGVLLILLELGAAVVLGIIGADASPGDAQDAGARSSYYNTKEWSDAYWREFEQARQNVQYHPYELWRMGPFAGDLIRVGPDGLRDTPGSECVSGAFSVAVFGGSTVWGLGVPDWGTLPSYLQKAVRQVLQRPVCVRNFGQLGFNSTQDLLALLGELRSGRVPDLVVFLSGVNDVIPAFQLGEAGIHTDAEDVEAALEGLRRRRAEQSRGVGWVQGLNLYRLASKLKGSTPRDDALTRFRYTSGHVSDTLAQSIVRFWLANNRIVGALADDYGFAYGFFWQPNVLVGAKPLTREEERFKAKEKIRPLVELVHGQLSAVGPPKHRFLHNLVDVFKGDTALRFIDWHHLTPEGNQRLAEVMALQLAAELRGS